MMFLRIGSRYLSMHTIYKISVHFCSSEPESQFVSEYQAKRLVDIIGLNSFSLFKKSIEILTLKDNHDFGRNGDGDDGGGNEGFLFSKLK